MNDLPIGEHPIDKWVASLPDLNTDEGKAKYAALNAAFDLVKNPVDWKAPILATIAAHDKAIVAEAIEFFTATKPVFSAYLPPIPGVPDAAVLLVEADGYRAGPAGP